MATVTVVQVGEPEIPLPLRRPSSPKLGDFTKIFDIAFSSSSIRASAKNTARVISRPASPVSILTDTDYTTTGPKLFSSLDLSKLVSPSKSHKSIVGDNGSSPEASSSAQKSDTPASVATEFVTPATGYSTPTTTPPTSHKEEKVTKPQMAPATEVHEQHDTPPAAPNPPKTPFMDPMMPALYRIMGISHPPNPYDMYQGPGTGYYERLAEYRKVHPVRDYGPYVLYPKVRSPVDVTPAPTPVRARTSYSINPMYMNDSATQIAILQARLQPEYNLDMRLAAENPKTSSQPIHIFVDLSNIIIGFYNCMKKRRGMRLDRRIKAPPFFFENFAGLLERNRPLAKKIVAGSIKNTWGTWPDYMVEAEACEYEMNILQRVGRDSQTPKKQAVDMTSGDSSDDAVQGTTKRTYPLKYGEQGVDELLHLKMTQSILDYYPATMVLATGDAAEAEYSDGFLKNVERALQRGWHIELIAWNRGISSAWRNQEFTAKWANQFRIIELDHYAEELLNNSHYDRPVQSLQNQPFLSRPAAL